MPNSKGQDSFQKLNKSVVRAREKTETFANLLVTCNLVENLFLPRSDYPNKNVS